MNQEELEAGKFYWVVEDGCTEIQPARYEGFNGFTIIGWDGMLFEGAIQRVICECVKPEVEG